MAQCAVRDVPARHPAAHGVQIMPSPNNG